jgi:hypothetical protein
MKHTSRIRWPILAGVLALGGLILSTVPARADGIDYKLPSEAQKVMKYLKKQGYHNVGMLKFRVKKGKKEVFNLGPINSNMATRLENSLIAINDEAKPIGFLRDPGKVIAGKKQRISYLTQDGRDKLFKLKYPLVWDKKLVEPDAFLTGEVSFTAKKHQTQVTVEVIDRTNRKLEKVLTFKVKTDRTILADMRENFALSKKRIRAMGPAEKEDEAAADSETRDNKPEKTQPTEGLVELTVKYDDEDQEISTDEVNPGEYKVAEPKEGAKVVLVIKNKSDQKVSVVLTVNGKNTLHMQDVDEKSPAGSSKWVLDPGDKYEIKGFYDEGNTSFTPFKVLSDEESGKVEEQATHAKLGSIAMYVFVEGSSKAGQEKINTQGLRSSLASTKKPPRSAKEAKKRVRSLRTQGLIGVEESTNPASLKSVAFKNPELQETRIIWYRKKGGKTNGD